jgi:hypothetical protein
MLVAALLVVANDAEVTVPVIPVANTCDAKEDVVAYDALVTGASFSAYDAVTAKDAVAGVNVILVAADEVVA